MAYMCITPTGANSAKMIGNVVNTLIECPSTGYIAYPVNEVSDVSIADTVQVTWMTVSVLIIAYCFKMMRRSVG